MHLIPDDAQDYYNKITGNLTIQDDIDGFSGTVDFQIEIEDQIKSNQSRCWLSNFMKTKWWTLVV